jgi:DNA-binding SARP family transcriptional activator/TolB-like protein
MQAADASGRSVLPRARKTRAVLAILAMSAPRPVLRLQLTGLLWSQRDRDQARASLRQAVHELQDILGPGYGRLLVADRHHLALRSEGLSVDALLAIQADKSPATCLDLLGSVLLEDLSGLDPAFDRWLDDERRRFQRIARSLAEGLLAEQRDRDGLLAAADRLLAIDQTHQGAWRAIMRAHADAGDRAAALNAYERCRSALADADQAVPSADTDELAARIRASGPALPVNREAANEVWEAPAERPVAPEIRGHRGGVRLSIPPLRTIGAVLDDELSIGLAEEITTALSRFRWISCVPNLALTAIAGETGAEAAARSAADTDFVLDGTVQRGANRVRVMARLLDMRASGTVVWARRFDRPSVDSLTLQDEIGAAIVAQVDPELMMREGERVAARRQKNASAQDLVIQAIPAIYRLERSSFRSAGGLLEHALAVDPHNPEAHAWYAYWHLFLVGQGWAPDPQQATRRGADLAERAVTLDSGDARAVTLAGHVRGFLGKQPEEASALHERALSLNPNLALAWCFSGLAHSYLGRHDEAIRRIHQAVQLSPSDPHLFFFNMAMVMPHLLRGDFERAVEIGRQAVELNPWFSSSHKGYLAALGHLGRLPEAAQILTRLLALEPGFSVAEAIKRSPIGAPDDIATYAEGLRKAGLRDIAPG